MENTKFCGLFFFDQDRQPELENIGTRREVNGKCELKITDQISSAHEKQKISLFRLFHCNSRLQKLGKTWNLFSIRFCFGNSWEKKAVRSTQLSLQLFYPSYKA